MANEKSTPVVLDEKPANPVKAPVQMGTRVVSDPVLIEVPTVVKQHNKGFDMTPHYQIQEEITYPQMAEKGLAPLIRNRAVTAEKLNELGVEPPKES